MFRINDGKPVSRRKSSTPQKRIVDVLTMVDKVAVSSTSNAATTIAGMNRPSSHGATTSSSVFNHGALEKNPVKAAETNSTNNNPLIKNIPSLEEPFRYPSACKTVIDQALYGKGAQKKPSDIHALYAGSHTQTKPVGIPNEPFKELPPCPPAIPLRKKTPTAKVPSSMSAMEKKVADKRDKHSDNNGKKIVDSHELNIKEQGFQGGVPLNGPAILKKGTVSDEAPPTTMTEIKSENMSQSGSNEFQVMEMELHEIIQPQFVKCEPDPPLPIDDFPSTSAQCNPKKRVRKSNSDSIQPVPKKRASSAMTKKQGDADPPYRARNVYESDCTSNAASDTGTLPQGNNAKRRSNICPYKDCSQSFARPWRLAAHIRKHKGERPFRCEIEGCSRDYTNPSHLRRHVLRNHSEPKEKLMQVCPSEGCFMTLASAATLKRHIERRHGPCNFECDQCNEKFRKHGELRNHKRTHGPSLDLLYMCTTCDSGFNDKRLYKKHVRSHRTYPCLVAKCNQVFVTWTTFLKHTKNDHPASKYECAICSRAFTVKKNLEFHLETHKDFSERTKLTCQYRNCQKFYYQQRNLTAHVKRCHCNDTFDCPFPNCTSKLSTKQKLSLHMESVHGLARGSGMEFIKLEAKARASSLKAAESELVVVQCDAPIN